ncbi:TolC family protein [Arcticibacter tournemirensis]
MRKTLLMILAISTLSLQAQERFTLKKCVEYGLKNHRNNTIYANRKIAADAQIREALAAYLPQISVSSTLDDNLNLQETTIPAGILGPEETRVAFSQKYSADANARLDQMIFDKSLLTSLKANKYHRKSAELSSVQSQEGIIYNVSNAYFQILIYRQQLNLLRANKESYEKQIEIFRLQVEKGVAIESDLNKVRVDYNNTLSQIRLAESNVQLTENELKYEMGYPIDNSLLIDTALISSMPTLLSPAGNPGFIPSSKTDYQITATNVQLLKIEEDRIRAQGLPVLSGYALYGQIGYGDNIRQSYKDLDPYSAIGLKLSIPLFNFYKRNAQHAQARVERLNAEENLKLDEEKYKLEYQNARTKLSQTQINMESDRRNITLAESTFRLTDLQFQKGVTSLVDWLNTQNSLKEAQNSYLESLYNYFLARLDLEKAAGSLHSFYNSL